MKIALTSIFLNSKYNNVDPWGLEFYYLKELFEYSGFEVDFIGKVYSKNKHLEFFKDFRTVDINEYDAVLCFPSRPIFFAGKYGESDQMVELMANFKGIVIQTLSDPLVKTTNPAERLYKRFGICEEWIEAWDNINDRSYFIFPGKDIQKWCRYAPTGTYIPHNRIIKYDWFTYIHRHALLENKNNSSLFEFNNNEKKWDVLYYGNSNRAGFREQQLRKYFPKDTKNLLVGYKSDKINATQIDKIPHTELIEKNIRIESFSCSW